MSVQPGQSPGDEPARNEGRFSALISSLTGATSAGRATRAARTTPAAPGGADPPVQAEPEQATPGRANRAEAEQATPGQANRAEAEQATPGQGSRAGADGGQAAPARPTFTAGAAGPATVVPREPAGTPGPGGSGRPDGLSSRVRRAPAPPGTPADAASTGAARAPVPPGTPADAASAGAVPAPVPPPSVPPARVAPAAPAPAPGTPAPVPPAAVTRAPVPPDDDRTRALPQLAAAATDAPLLEDAEALRKRWQRVQAGFVDGPQEAVGQAADLIEQTAQALIGALRQRQRELRVMWERGAAAAPPHGEAAGSPDGEAASRAPDTEHLRQMMQRYRALFNQLCRP